MDNFLDLDQDDHQPAGSIPGCGCSACSSPLAMARMIVCVSCGNKRCPHAAHHGHPCSNSNDTGQWGSSYGVRVDGEFDRTESLIWAASQGDLEQATRLMDQGADTEARCAAGLTSLLHAATGGHPRVMELLLSRGADLRAISVFTSHSALHLLLFTPEFEDQSRTRDCVDLLLRVGVDPNEPLAPGRFEKNATLPLIAAAKANQARAIEALATHGARIDAKGEFGRTALMAAAEANNLEAVLALLATGADPLIQDDQGKDAMAIARANPSASALKIVDAILQARARIDQAALGSATPAAAAEAKTSSPRI